MDLKLREPNSDTGIGGSGIRSLASIMQQYVSKAGFQGASRYAIGGPPGCQGTTVANPMRHRIESFM